MRILALQDVRVAADGLGLRIKRARGRRHLKQWQLAELVEVNRKTVDNWENERTRPGPDRIAALEAVLGSLAPEVQPPDPREEELRDLGVDRGGFLDSSEVDHLVRQYRQRRTRPPETRAG